MFGAAVSQDYFAWSQTRRLKPHHYNLFAQAMVAGAWLNQAVVEGPKCRKVHDSYLLLFLRRRRRG